MNGKMPNGRAIGRIKDYFETVFAEVLYFTIASSSAEVIFDNLKKKKIQILGKILQLLGVLVFSF